MRLGEPDASGRRSPVETGETITLDVDMVIKAAGQTPYADLVAGSGLGDSKGRIVVGEGGSTGLAYVFAGGDCVNGGKEVVDAVQAGKETASAILQLINS
jgi:glutamate synthase (NADPH/NADH) small chain